MNLIRVEKDMNGWRNAQCLQRSAEISGGLKTVGGGGDFLVEEECKCDIPLELEQMQLNEAKLSDSLVYFNDNGRRHLVWRSDISEKVG
jgi:hypothetical protein